MLKGGHTKEIHQIKRDYEGRVIQFAARENVVDYGETNQGEKGACNQFDDYYRRQCHFEFDIILFGCLNHIQNIANLKRINQTA